MTQLGNQVCFGSVCVCVCVCVCMCVREREIIKCFFVSVRGPDMTWLIVSISLHVQVALLQSRRISFNDGSRGPLWYLRNYWLTESALPGWNQTIGKGNWKLSPLGISLCWMLKLDHNVALKDMWKSQGSPPNPGKTENSYINQFTITYTTFEYFLLNFFFTVCKMAATLSLCLSF